MWCLRASPGILSLLPAPASRSADRRRRPLNQLGDGTRDHRFVPTGLYLSKTRALQAGLYHTFAADWGWLSGMGSNGYGQLGVGDTQTRTTPVSIGPLE